MKHRIEDDIKVAMKSGDKSRLAVLRLVLSEIKRVEVDSRKALNDDRVLDVLAKMIKQRRESIKQFAAAGRVDLQTQEEFELKVIRSYMPQPLTDAELEGLIDEAIAQAAATSLKDMSKVMAAIKAQARGRVDLSLASRIVKTKLGVA